MPCRRRNHDSLYIGPKQKSGVEWPVEQKNKFVFGVLLHHSGKQFFRIMAITFEAVFLEKYGVNSYAHTAKVAAIAT